VRAERSPKPRTKAAKSKTQDGTEPAEVSDGSTQVFKIIESLGNDYDQVWGSMVKQTVKRVYPGFSESSAGFNSFHDLLEGLEDQGLVELEWDEKRGNYLVRQRRGKRG
jgi:hypothetical protein